MYIAITPLTFIGAGFLVTIATKRFDFLVGRKVRYLVTPAVSDQGFLREGALTPRGATLLFGIILPKPH